MLASCNNLKRHPALRYYYLNVSQLVCNRRKRATRCSQVIGWLVWMGLMSAFQIWCEVLENEYFPYLLAFLLGSMSAVSQNSCLSWLDFGNSLAQCNKELWHSQNSCLSGSDFWHFSDPKWWRIMAFPKFVSFCIQKCSNFVLWVSFLAGVINWK